MWCSYVLPPALIVHQLELMAKQEASNSLFLLFKPAMLYNIQITLGTPQKEVDIFDMILHTDKLTESALKLLSQRKKFEKN